MCCAPYWPPGGNRSSPASWFLAFAIQNPARVRTLGLVEILVAGLVSRRFFAQTPSLRDIAGMVPVTAGIFLLFNS